MEGKGKGEGLEDEADMEGGVAERVAGDVGSGFGLFVVVLVQLIDWVGVCFV